VAFITPNRRVTTAISTDGVQNAESVRQLAEKYNISLYPLDIELLVSRLGIVVLREDGEDDFSGCIEQRSDGNYYLSVNKYHNARRQRFTMAHELGHYFLHREKLNEIGRETILMREPMALTQVEREANDFASELLIPKPVLDAQIHQGVSQIEDLADFFQVSVPALKYRAIRLGYLRK
jgi:Zn-dependent peptidase ImmA (M78 family)